MPIVVVAGTQPDWGLGHARQPVSGVCLQDTRCMRKFRLHLVAVVCSSCAIASISGCAPVHCLLLVALCILNTFIVADVGLVLMASTQLQWVGYTQGWFQCLSFECIFLQVCPATHQKSIVLGSATRFLTRSWLNFCWSFALDSYSLRGCLVHKGPRQTLH
jgi:hypothetical protein